MPKKNVGLRLELDCIDKLKALSEKFNKPLGDVIEGLITFSETQINFDDCPSFNDRFRYLFEASMVNAGIHGGWIMTSDMRDDETKMDYIKRKTAEELEAKAQEAKTERDSFDK